MRTRFLPRLTNYEVERYLDKNDIIIVPVGTVEMHGGMPLDCETVISEAFALKMAEKVNGLVLNNLPYFYAGATASGRGTVQVSVRAGIDYLYQIAKSLLTKGFKRQIYISFHGPAHMTCSPMVRDFFDDTKVPILYLDLCMSMFKKSSGVFKDINDFHYISFGAYELMGRLEDIPLSIGEGMDFSEQVEQTVAFANPLFDMAYQSGSIGYYFGDPKDHMPTPRVESAEQRLEYAKRGIELIEQIVDDIDMENVVEMINDLDKFYNEEVAPKYGEWLPKTRV
ncbi:MULTISPECIES: creatininase family protein [Romboutsia]|uniref:Creatininase n=1 Tax=Romboutsia hominis TaxID=1507512 RepID=A0A2P2BQW4_9FIRM|nr:MULTISPECIES: creatininase family protein [Romboutsia]MDB8804843.1 creatininase family protein [Romboutsia sp. 1001216sp1]MDB8808158.1 creatininase family protein [Romboutsia sp. 1001216sp1]MDB8810489.1 creatininase family protein [Romboutsia sp. 1001216sp1]MDB8816208.1 creatininase family protein [Romboutsia sp. 1001216sp1]MDB8818838.1 creatininase family protein [Romboutsia sp. 1001216sp1]